MWLFCLFLFDLNRLFFILLFFYRDSDGHKVGHHRISLDFTPRDRGEFIRHRVAIVWATHFTPLLQLIYSTFLKQCMNYSWVASEWVQLCSCTCLKLFVNKSLNRIFYRVKQDVLFSQSKKIHPNPTLTTLSATDVPLLSPHFTCEHVKSTGFLMK